MSGKKQIFQTDSRGRWLAFQWSSRLIIALVILVIPVVIFSLKKMQRPELPLLSHGDSIKKVIHPVVPVELVGKERERYKGFTSFLKERKKAELSQKKASLVTGDQVRAAFYVDWDPQSFYSLQQHIQKLNMIVPEWLFIDPQADTLVPRIDTAALRVMKKSNCRIVALINNINLNKRGEFDGAILHRILHDPAKSERLINDIAATLHRYGLQGVNIDFEEFQEKSDEPIIAFQRRLYEKLHLQGLLVTQDIMPYNDDYNVKELARYNDYFFLMAYDEHFGSSVPGPVSSQQWIEKVLDENAKEIPSEKIILCLAAYGYDWPEDEEATNLTYQQALAQAHQYQSDIKFDNTNYNNHFSYTDADSVLHTVYFADAATNFNTIRFSDEYGAAGTAIWRLGSEDERIWSFYNRSLTNNSLATQPFSFAPLETVNITTAKPDYVGEGEVLNVVTKPTQGKISLDVDQEEKIIAEQHYEVLPTRYVIQRYGKVNNQVLLSFDDGPDPEYTPQILDILKKEKVPATFFVVGMEAESNLPLLKRIYREGHEIGNHTFTHPNMAEVDQTRAIAEMEATRLLIEAVTGRSTILFRAPYNADSEPTSEVELKPVALSKDKKYYTVGESIDPEDWEKGVNADTIYNRVIAQYNRNPEKGIILLHDAGGDRQATVDALPRIIHYFKERGVQFTTVASLLHTGKDALMPPVQSPIMKIDSGIASAGYWLQQFLTIAFWTAIVLGLARIIMLGVMAGWQRKRSRKAAIMPFRYEMPGVSIIVPGYNEEVNAVKTVASLLKQDYALFEVVFVDDGSKDRTYEMVQQAFEGNDRVRVLTKANGGKASALNFGIAECRYEFLVCIDADTLLMPDAVRRLMEKMLSAGDVGAVAGNVKVGNQKNLITKWQSIEYTTAQNFDRRAFDLINGITVVPGAIGAFRKESLFSVDMRVYINNTMAAVSAKKRKVYNVLMTEHKTNA